MCWWGSLNDWMLSMELPTLHTSYMICYYRHFTPCPIECCPWNYQLYIHRTWYVIIVTPHHTPLNVVHRMTNCTYIVHDMLLSSLHIIPHWMLSMEWTTVHTSYITWYYRHSTPYPIECCPWNNQLYIHRTWYAIIVTPHHTPLNTLYTVNDAIPRQS